MKDEYDFSKGVRGRFYHLDARLNMPVYRGQGEAHDIGQAIERFRQRMNPADYPDNEDIFADVRDRSAGREVVL